MEVYRLYSQTNSDQCLIRITEDSNSTVTDESDAVFSIIRCNLTVTDGRVGRLGRS